MVKNSSAFGDLEISPLSGAFDLRSPSGTMPISDFRLVLNASMNEFGKRCRRPQFKKYGADSPMGFNNQDLHFKLDGYGYYCGGGEDDCPCPGTPNCLRIVDYDPDNFITPCDGLVTSEAEAWDGRLTRIDDCRWGFSYGQFSILGVDFAAILTIKECDSYGDNVYQLSFIGRDSEGAGVTIWSGEANNGLIGKYPRTGGCDESVGFILENCDVCVAPVITAAPESGVVASGTYISLFATEGAVIYFTTDGSTPDNTSEEYTGPFAIYDATTVKAIAYSSDCVSEVETFTYTINSDFIFEFTCDDEDQAGVFFEFEPNGSADYNWRLRFTLPEVDIQRIEIYETNAQGVWVTGQAWATDNPVHPAEFDGGEFDIYPVVIYEGGTKLNTEYETVVLPAYPAGAHEWMMYGQPATALVGYFRIIMFYSELGVDKTITAVIPHECYYYY